MRRRLRRGLGGPVGRRVRARGQHARPPRPLPKFVPIDAVYAAGGASAAWGLSAVIQPVLGDRAGAALPYALAALALVGGLRAVTAPRRVLRSGAVGLMVGAHPAFDTGFAQLRSLGVVPTPVLAGAAYFGWFGFWFGWVTYATGGGRPFGTPAPSAGGSGASSSSTGCG